MDKLMIKLLRDEKERKAKLSHEEIVKEKRHIKITDYLKPYVIDMSVQLPEQQPLISIDNCCVCSRGNISTICGEAKSKKTFLASALVASAMALPLDNLDNFKNVKKNKSMNVLWVDTEQGERHVRRVVERISYMTGATASGQTSESRLITMQLRELNPTDRFWMVFEAIDHYDIDLVVIDGIADLQNNTNNLEESDELVGDLMAISTACNIHILCILHTNPGSDKARGHLGSSLQRKSESVIFVHRDGECSIAEPQFCRNEPFERFAFSISEEGIPQLCDLPAIPTTGANDKVIEILSNEYGGVVERQTLINKVCSILGVNSDAARMRISRLINKGTLMADGNRIRVSTPTTAPTTATTETDARTNERTNGGVQDVQNVRDVQNVQNVQDVQNVQEQPDDSCAFTGKLFYEMPKSRYAHPAFYDDSDDCPF